MFWHHVLIFKTFFLGPLEGNEILENSTLSAQVNNKYTVRERRFGHVAVYNHSRVLFFPLKECFCAVFAQISKETGMWQHKFVYLSPSLSPREHQTWAEPSLITGIDSKVKESSRRGWRVRKMISFLLGCAATKPLRCWGKRESPNMQNTLALFLGVAAKPQALTKSRPPKDSEERGPSRRPCFQFHSPWLRPWWALDQKADAS